MYQYQLKMELQVVSNSSDPDVVEAMWRERLGFSGAVVSVEAAALFDVYAHDSTITRHLIRYLANAEKRTGQKWVVVERYKTSSRPRGIEYDRALLRAEDGSTVRIYYRWRCWVRGQKVLAPKST